MIADGVRRLAVRDLPEDLTLVEADCRDGSVRRLDERQALHLQTSGAAVICRRHRYLCRACLRQDCPGGVLRQLAFRPDTYSQHIVAQRRNLDHR